MAGWLEPDDPFQPNHSMILWSWSKLCYCSSLNVKVKSIQLFLRASDNVSGHSGLSIDTTMCIQQGMS